ncbi:hypothetical protein PTMSG1_02017 [Pyrenophora teres f. maculata]|nr:hypothetical protein PTMSG1_02017 [Pyrenophora teres f. maculata]
MPKAVRASTRRTQRHAEAVERPGRVTRLQLNPQLTTKTPVPSNSTTRRKLKTQSLPLYTRSQTEISADPNRLLPLFCLPREIIQDIAANHLPLDSAVSLTLTCKEALAIIGTWSWLQFKKLERLSLFRECFVRALARDCASEDEAALTYCSICNTLHPPLHIPRNHIRTALTPYCFGQDDCVSYFPRMNDERGYSLVFDHVAEALRQSSEYAKKGCHGPQINLLAGDYTVKYPKLELSWQITSKGRRVDGNLIVQHIHTFQTLRDYNNMRGKKSLYAADILALPIRLCPHQSTVTTGPRAPSRYIKSEEKNSPQFTHAITTAFPTTKRERVGGTYILQQRMNNAFSHPTPRELEAMNAANAGDKNILWCCRSCPTKYRIEFSGKRLKILAWHSFGRDQLHASKCWKWFVRREGKLLGTSKRNDEWWSPARTVPDFKIGEGGWEDELLGVGKE